MQVVYGVMSGKLGTNATGASSYYIQVFHIPMAATFYLWLKLSDCPLLLLTLCGLTRIILRHANLACTRCIRHILRTGCQRRITQA